MTTKLLQPLRALAPLTRFRANDDHVPLDIVVDYYAQRATRGGTLLVTEGTFITERAGGMGNVPGLYTKEQLDSWKKVTDAVHAKGSYIFCQLWALGRAADPGDLSKLGHRLVSSSDVPMEEGGPSPTPLTESEIQEYIRDYATAAVKAVKEAGFDGVEIHGANGYLPNQFTDAESNQRSDSWGGSIANRSKFTLSVAKAVSDAVGADRTALRLSPFSTFQGMRRQGNPSEQYQHLVKNLRPLGLAYLHLVESRISGNADVESSEQLDSLVDIWDNASPVLIAGGYKPDSAKRLVDEHYRNHDVVVVFGRYFISNPDLVYRIENNIPLQPYDRSTFYTPKKTKGYTDYPASKEALEAEGRL